MRRWLSALLFTLASLAAQPASAQSASEIAAARALFEEGVAAAGEARWADALSAFQRSYDIAPRSSTLLNLAGAQVQLGQLVAASESYRRLIRDAGSNARERRLREQAQEALDALTPRLARLTLRIPDLASTDRVTLDDVEVAHAIVGLATPVDPGSHRVAVVRGGAEIGRATVSLAEGESGELDVVLRPTDTASVAADDRPDDEVPDEAFATGASTSTADGGGEDLTLPIVLTVVGVVVVGGVVAAVVATQVPGSPSYYTGNIGDGQIRF